ncbi:DUF4139 domain-containing protein [Altererythrobacter lutimaris]|uniref:DUF4139 domain-containing protein n=1 Tax=Altererythrobacter lutimaris TaxID=2743979 RepID=A0A850H8H7_9SPHN|nr:DUF4139 domain-containing protein [Altererythrobacter lutimaris]NVE94089.1 DUF4139 domain-containing protein [Altererythrobacter lutimaris]
MAQRTRRFARNTAVFALVAAALPALAQSSSEETAQGDLAVTIYNNDQALVQDVRQLNIPRGRSKIEFPDVSARIRPETLSFNAAGAGIIEQNFDFDLLTPAKMMEKAIGQTVTLVRTNPATGRETTERAKVLSTAGGVVVQIGNRIEVLRDDGLPVRVVFDRVPPNLRARPTLSVNVDATRGGVRPASIRYLTTGLRWNADYVALFDEATNTIDMQGWVTLTNNTGTTFHRADTLLVAGNPGQGRRNNNRNMVRPGTQSADRERLGDYYLYPISERTTIANAQTKQVSFLDVQGVPARKVYSRNVGWLTSDGAPVNVSSDISFTSSSDGGLGDALPAGTVRFYQRDQRGSPQFIGENRIGHTPMGSTLSLTTGEAFDVLVQAEVERRDRMSEGEWEATSRFRVVEDDGRTRTYTREERPTYYRTTMRYTFTNAKSSAVEVVLSQNGLDRGWWTRDFRVTSEDVEGVQVNANTRRHTVSVPANGERIVRVTYATRY